MRQSVDLTRSARKSPQSLPRVRPTPTVNHLWNAFHIDNDAARSALLLSNSSNRVAEPPLGRLHISTE